MKVPERLALRSITAQITGIVIAAVVLGVGLAAAVLMYFFFNAQAGANPQLVAATTAARIAAIVHNTEAARSPEDLARVLKEHRWPEMRVQATPAANLGALPNVTPHNPAFMRSVKAMLANDWGITPLPGAPSLGGHDAIAVKIGDAGLLFDATPHVRLRNFLATEIVSGLAIVTFIIVFLSLYALRFITAPLSSIASAARSFRLPTADDAPIDAKGPREIAEVAEALNDMRRRVSTLVNERTQMLAAISHDLRTPLTRLRLRSERLADAGLRDSMMRDIATINDMLSETLAYLRDGGRSESSQLVDLPSMVQTICAEFVDIGFDVSYEGPDRLAFVCRVDALSRAVTNVVDNATKHGTTVAVTLRLIDERTAQIEISDDGPGIPASLRSKVFEPFFKADSARPSSGRGFGLGLSIARDIALRHDGEIDLLDNDPSGLRVRLTIRMRRDERLQILLSQRTHQFVDV
ncbi:MAG TPA: ATP-binding protein [Roseiarcus sp.]|jgi:signal transduction histidine kinase